MKRLRVKKTVFPDKREFKNMAEYRLFLDRVQDFNLWQLFINKQFAICLKKEVKNG